MEAGLVSVDVTFDIRSDAGGRDPDRYSAMLRRYHRALWSKPLPGGEPFELADVYPDGYLQHSSRLATFNLSSDMIHRTFRHMRRAQGLIQQIPATYLEDFARRGCTLGGTMLFPANRVDGKHTINQARGVNRKIEDRFDRTLECIRRHYIGEPSPLESVLSRYASFFALFGDFSGYVDHFLLQDLIGADGRVEMFLGDTSFESPAIPETVDEYMAYSARSGAFVDSRNERIRAWVEAMGVAVAD